MQLVHYHREHNGITLFAENTYENTENTNENTNDQKVLKLKTCTVFSARY